MVHGGTWSRRCLATAMRWCAKPVGPGHQDADAASVRTNIPISQSTGLFFYEVTIMSKGRHGYIGDTMSLSAKLCFCRTMHIQLSNVHTVLSFVTSSFTPPINKSLADQCCRRLQVLAFA